KDSAEALSEHAIMKMKLDAFINPQLVMGRLDEKDQSYTTRYGRAIAYYQLKEPDKALKIIDNLLTQQPDNPYLYELKGQILFEFGRADEAEAPQRKSVELKPEAPLLRINLGQTLIALTDEKKVDEGIGELKRSLAIDDENAEAWRLLAQAYDHKEQDGLARYATAEYNFQIGNRQQALVFAMRAREKLEKSTPEWRRATDIVLASSPSKDDLKDLAKEGSIRRGSIR
ncbi:MAG: tetratricopeptide repeat protein, partial [Phenylobacterium sp.]|nr:tetratricopeptide repeat protein [Phenylobacterium sp.]